MVVGKGSGPRCYPLHAQTSSLKILIALDHMEIFSTFGHFFAVYFSRRLVSSPYPTSCSKRRLLSKRGQSLQMKKGLSMLNSNVFS